MRCTLAIALGILIMGCQRPLASVSWEVLTTPTSASLRGVSAIDADMVWISGSDGSVLHTTDAGRTWTTSHVSGGESLDFRDVEALDAHTAVIASAGTPARIYRTTDAGATWTLVHAEPDPAAFFDALAFRDERHGIAFSDPVDGAFLVLRTTDGGQTWQRVAPDNLPAPLDGEAGFAASGTCAAMFADNGASIVTGGTTTRVLLSDDGGDTWQARSLPMRHGASSQGAFAMAWRGSTAIVVGGDYRAPEDDTGNHAITRDRGKTWTTSTRGPRGYRCAVAPIPATQPPAWICAGRTGTDLSLDDGETWRPVDNVRYHAIDLVPGGGWAVGPAGRVARLKLEFAPE